MFETDSRTALWGISPILLLMGVLFHVCSLAAPYWLSGGQSNLGLWTFCTRTTVIAHPADSQPDFAEPEEEVQCVKVHRVLTSGSNNSSGSSTDFDHSWFRAVQGVEIAATVFVLTSTLTALMRINLGHRIWQVACGLSALIAGVFGVVGDIVFGKNYSSIQSGGLSLSWAYVFNAASSALLFLSGPVLILDALVNHS